MQPYDIIYADPPWSYGSRGPRGGKYGELDYSCMSLEEICSLNVRAIAADNCALFLWFTGSFMGEVCQVAEAWGFRPVRIDKVWAKKKASGKPHAAVGPWGMSDAEFILLAVRGSMCSQQQERNQNTVVEAEYPGMHSRKPEIFRELIERRFPNARRLEMFARQASPGWDVFGNEVEGSISIPYRQQLTLFANQS